MRVPSEIAVVPLLILAACSQPKPVQDKAYYAAHSDARTAEIAACRNDPGGIGETPNCAAAAAAAADVESTRFWAIKKPKPRLTNPGSL